MVCSFARRLEHEKYNDVAIVTIEDLLQEQLTWNQVRNFIGGFLTEHMRMIYRSIQPCYLGQAIVHLGSALGQPPCLEWFRCYFC